MYWLFVKEVPADAVYGYIPDARANSIGQAVVKEAWSPEEVQGEDLRLESVSRSVESHVGGRLVRRQDRFLPYLQHGDRVYHAKAKLGLFIMLKLDPQTPGTDDGWVYGTVTADGKEVLSVGRVESCMGCHKDAPHDRLFGVADR
jgi:hypothetical protein